MITPTPGDQQGRPIASCETSFWAFLEYPAFWVPVVALTILAAIALAIFAAIR